MQKIRYSFHLDNENQAGEKDLFMSFNIGKEKAKIGLKCKIKPNLWYKLSSHYIGPNSEKVNYLIEQLIKKIKRFEIDTSNPNLKTIKSKLLDFIDNYHNVNPSSRIDYSKTPKNRFTFIDFFAGAGGFSEGFMQAHTKDNWFDFILASDIDENCELTHKARYNEQLGLSTKFLKKNITDYDFLPKLKELMAPSKEVDVIVGGPPCQSFSLAGRRREFDVKNNLFYHYLKIIRELKPKYFVMENVKGLINKDGGKIKDEILSQIRSIIDLEKLDKINNLIDTIKDTRKKYLEGENKKRFRGQYDKFAEEWLIMDVKKSNRQLDNMLRKFRYETTNDLEEKKKLNSEIVKNMAYYFKEMKEAVPYDYSKNDKTINTIRHGLRLLSARHELEDLKTKVTKVKSLGDVDNDFIVDKFDSFNKTIDAVELCNSLCKRMKKLKSLIIKKDWQKDGKRLKYFLDQFLWHADIYQMSYDGCITTIRDIAKNHGMIDNFIKVMEEVSLYSISEEPLILDSSLYGVPQKRERAVFIGCRNDQTLIGSIPRTVKKPTPLKDAIDDLDETLNGDKRISNYAKQSIKGRLPSWYKVGKPFYVKSISDVQIPNKKLFQENGIPLNMEKSNQTENVKKRLKIIKRKGGYRKAKEDLKEEGLLTGKRNYKLLEPEKPGPTMVTLPDDFIHYNDPRPLTVREMARVQSFDDSFVFQGKRTTGGHRRKLEIPQFTLVGNAVPPLMAKAIAKAILKKIK